MTDPHDEASGVSAGHDDNNGSDEHHRLSGEHSRHDRPPMHGIRSQSREPERALGRSFVHGSHYSTAHSRFKAGTPEIGVQWPAYASEGVREETAELASLALSDANDIHRFHISMVSPEFRSSRKPRDGHDDDGLLFSKQKERTTHLPDVPIIPGSAGPSTLTHLLKTSPPDIPDAAEAIKEDEDDSRDIENVVLMASPSPMSERDALLPKRGSSGSGESIPNYLSTAGRDEEGQYSRSKSLSSAWQFGPIKSRTFNPRSWDRKQIWRHGVLTPLGYIPAVILGLLLNVLDGLSYGMILFPLGEPIFSKLGPDGLSMFYVSCIISQLVYSLGGSAFKGGIGSEMIEVVPFFHKMAYTIMNEVGKQNEKAVIATTILAFSISSIVTGLVFFGLGALRLGSLVGFFPRHILVGSIGMVGFFLIVTGMEVSARLSSSLEYNLETFKKLIQGDTIFLWTTPLSLAILLIALQHKIKHPFLVPAYFVMIPIIFFAIVAIVPSLHIEDLRKTGWVFEGPASGKPFWNFYTLYDFGATEWTALFNTLPSMLALSFFGLLHVPINVPALAVSTNEDSVNVDRELIAHGISNVASGMAGSIQNYLVYTNSVLFIRSGGDSRVAGIMLAVATAGVWMIGPGVIGYIPVMVVAALIFLLGIELLREALYDTWEKLHMLEYLTICAIIIVGAWDFVYGILVGILLACVSFVVQTSQKSAIRATYSGAVARSTVRRHPFQQRFLKEVGPQIQICKLAGYMFFGTISSVEESIKELLDEQNFAERPIRFLIIDLRECRGFDFSSTEAFRRLKRILGKKNVNMVLSGVQRDSDIGKALKGVGIWGADDDDVRVFEDLNGALECCENEFLRAFYMRREELARHSHLEVPREQSRFADGQPNPLEPTLSSPRRQHVQQAATSTIKETEAFSSKWSRFKQPLPLILQTFQERTLKNEDFWFKAVPFFQRKVIKKGTVLFRRGDDASEFFLLEEGILKAEYIIEQGKYYESILAGTTCGELPFFSETIRTSTVVAERDSVAWVLDGPSWENLQENQPEVANELLRIALKLTTERMEAVTSYVLTSAS